MKNSMQVDTQRVISLDVNVLQTVESQMLNDGVRLVGRAPKNDVAAQLSFRHLNFVETERDDCFEYTKIIRGAVLLLTNNRNAIELFNWIGERAEVFVCSDRLDLNMIKRLRPRLVVSYNYQHIVPADVIRFMGNAIINLHISYLPWNRGSSPNLWSIIDDTPKGVTIHKMAAGLDTGDIICQRRIDFDETHETLASSYRRLNYEIFDLLKIHWDEIYNGDYVSQPQSGRGSYHRQKDLTALLDGKTFSWDMTMLEFKNFISSKGD